MPDFSTYAWNQLAPATTPSARWGHAMVWDGSRIIMFGGHDAYAVGSGNNAETWEFDGSDWNLLSPATSPSARNSHSMVFDGTNVILHGGASASSGALGLQDTWVFDGSDWTNVTPGGTKPAARFRHSAVWNGSAMIIYGGQAGSGVKKDTWSWNGSAWTQLTPTNYVVNITHPGSSTALEDGRAGMPLIWDTARIVGFSGFSDSGGGGEFESIPYYESGGGSWQYASSNWTQIGPTTNPAARWGQGFCVTDDDQKVLMFGGNVSYVSGLGNAYNSETWQFDTDWTNLGVTSPSSRQAPLIWDDFAARGLMFGGRFSDADADVFDETWEFATGDSPVVKAINHAFGLG